MLNPDRPWTLLSLYKKSEHDGLNICEQLDIVPLIETNPLPPQVELSNAHSGTPNLSACFCTVATLKCDRGVWLISRSQPSSSFNPPNGLLESGSLRAGCLVGLGEGARPRPVRTTSGPKSRSPGRVKCSRRTLKKPERLKIITACEG